MMKENLIPNKSNKFIFIISSILMFSFSLINWLIIPFSLDSICLDIEYNVFFILILSSLNAYCLVLAGWASNSKYALLGSLRSSAQLISYEIFFGLLLVPIYAYAGSMNISDIVLAQENVWFCFLFFPIFIIFLIAALAETNRTPFDLPEAEAEIVAGYNVEYSGIVFSFFFLAEYNNILIASATTTALFLGGWLFFGISSEIIFIIKMVFVCMFFINIRATLPRYRYDQLIVIGWKKFLPVSLAITICYISFLHATTWSPNLIVMNPILIADLNELNNFWDEVFNKHILKMWCEQMKILEFREFCTIVWEQMERELDNPKNFDTQGLTDYLHRRVSIHGDNQYELWEYVRRAFQLPEHAWDSIEQAADRHIENYKDIISLDCSRGTELKVDERFSFTKKIAQIFESSTLDETCKYVINQKDESFGCDSVSKVDRNEILLFAKKTVELSDSNEHGRSQCHSNQKDKNSFDSSDSHKTNGGHERYSAPKAYELPRHTW